MTDPHWTPPAYLSPSQISSLLTCGEQYRLNRVVGVPERPQWGAVGGTAVHTLTERLDLDGVTDLQAVDDLWSTYWEAAMTETFEKAPEFHQSVYYASARGKEDDVWWQEAGPKFVKTWLSWREHNGLELWWTGDPETGEIVPAIELEVWATREGYTSVRSIIDRVFHDPEDNLRIVDLKTGNDRFLPAWPQQIALNNLGLESTHGVRARWAGYWSPRKGGVAPWHDLDLLTSPWLWEQVKRAAAIRDQQLFIAHPSALCNTACGVRQWCVAMGGQPHHLDYDATLTLNNTHNTPEEEK